MIWDFVMASNKQKTCKSAKKRFRLVGGKKLSFKHRSANRNHILTKKNKDRKRGLRGPNVSVDQSDAMRVKRLLRLAK